MAGKKYDADIPAGHAFAETRDLKPRDALLRRYGFKIHSRRRGVEAVWELEGVLMGQAEALAFCDGLVRPERAELPF